MKGFQYIWLLVVLCLLATAQELFAQAEESKDQEDIAGLRYPVPRQAPLSYQDLVRPVMGDLKNPENMETTIEYDLNSGDYVVRTRIGGTDVSTPISLTPEEFRAYWDAKTRADFFKKKNQIDYSKKKEAFSLTDLQFDIGAAEKIFGPGGVQLKTQGSAEVSFGVKNNIVNNPSLSERARNRTFFDFDQSIQLSVNGKVGDKINVNMNYDTEATFDFDSKAIKLRYEGKEDEIIKSLEAGNVSMPVKNSLINGASSLFGVKTQLQFGKLNIAAVLSQQNTQTKSASLSGGVQTTPFEISVDAYDENRHYFLSHYFRDNYDRWMENLPYISSGVVVNKVEVWVTNKTAVMDNARDILAFADMAEPERIYNAYWTKGQNNYPSNDANNLYAEMVENYAEARQINVSATVLEPLAAQGIIIGNDYERLESARRLEPTEYKLNASLGYISLNQALRSDEVLAVAFEYTKNGKVYQVGEFSTDGIESPKALLVKLLKGTDFSPRAPYWDLMMKNVYALGAYSMSKDNFKLNISFQNDTLGLYVNYISEGKIANQILLRVMNLDRLNLNRDPIPDGQFDYVEGYTVMSSNGRIIFPVLEPFGSHLRKAIGDDALAEKYIFQELYDSTLTVVQQLTEKNKFRIEGEYKSSQGGADISLGTMNVTRGSVKVTAGGILLTENVDYVVDYNSGTVSIINENLLSSGTTINATCEDQGIYNMVRKSLAGFNMEYAFSKDFSVGATLMHLSEKPLTNKVDMNTEPLNNTIMGLNTGFTVQSQGLTNLIDKLPLINVTKPSQLTVKAEVAQLKPGASKQIDNTVYVDDFETAKKTFSLRDVTQWFLASTPYDPMGGLFPEAAYSNDLRYGMNRALMSWYTIDQIFTQSRSQTPDHIRNDYEQLSNHYVRAVNEKEIYPDRDLQFNQTGLLSVMNISYYPKQRGPYNFDTEGMQADGTLANPEQRWGGIMRRIESSMTNFEAANVEYIEFWLMDPFIYDSLGVNTGGDLYFNLGEISEDVLKDGRKSFENGLPMGGDQSYVSETVWGKVSNKTVNVYAFDNTPGIRRVQDVGLDGLNDEEEAVKRADYLNALENSLNPDVLERWRNDPFSPLNDPSGDNFHYYRGSDYDRSKTSILDRYKYYNGTQGNSQASADTGENYETASTTLPDVEDINADFTLNETERYYQYKVSLRKQDLEIGQNYVNDKRTSVVRLKNGKSEQVTWYQFKIPIRDYDKKIGTINGFNSIRFIRMFLTSFQDSTVLRFGSLDLVRGDWRVYTKDLAPAGVVPASETMMEVTTVDLEENSSREPIHYVLPPGVEREGDPSQPGVYQQNEQSLALRIRQMAPGDARAVYKNTGLDFRQYERLQLFVHGEALPEDLNPPANYEMTVFIRLGSDYQNNYYEYEVPLKISQPHVHNPESVWPEENFIDLPFELLTSIKNRRNSQPGGINYTKAYYEYDPVKEKNKVSIMGNPSLSEVKTIMIGIRNNGTVLKSVEVWVNELRLKGFANQDGWAAMTNATLAVSDLGTVSFAGRYESVGFGGIEQRVAERRLEDYKLMNLAMSFDLGKLYPKPGIVNFPVYYAISRQSHTPKYDPLNQDLLFEDVLKAANSKAEKDSILDYSSKIMNVRNLNVSNLRLNIKSKTPLPIDPANFSASGSFSETYKHDASTEYEITRNYNAGITYGYSSPLKAWEPFAKSKKLDSPWLKTIKEFNLTWIPNSVTFGSRLSRYYYELQNRDLTSLSLLNNIPLNFSKNFLWNTDFSLTWNFTKNMKFTFATNNSSRIQETVNSPVNKTLYPNEYENWKDTVRQSIRTLGTPLNYQQSIRYTWSIPFNRIPVLDFITANAQYTSTYKWDKSAEIKDLEMGNIISNIRNININPSFNFETLYNKSEFLRQVNQKYAASGRKTSTATGRSTSAKVSSNQQSAPKQEAAKFEKELQLSAGEELEVKHNLKNKRLIIRAVDSKGKEVPLRYKIVDENNLSIRGRDSMQIKLLVVQKPPLDDKDWYKALQLGSRLLMSVRNLHITYDHTDGLTIPGFKPETGLIFKDEEFGRAPGWDFASGFYSNDYLQQSMARNWLVMSDSVVSPAIYTESRKLTVRSSVSPFQGLRIELNAQRSNNSNKQVQYMIDGMPRTQTGGFSISTVALLTSFRGSSAKDGYYSRYFEQFVQNRTVIAGRLQQRIEGLRYPNEGFLVGTELAGKAYDAQYGGIDLNSADVLIPAFMAAYTGRSVHKGSLDIFPSIKAMLPNWTISYDGLSKLPFLAERFRSITLNHAYNCAYNVTSYSSYNNFVGVEGEDFGFVRDVLTGNPLPSSMYDISSISLTENFSPLFNIQATLKNGMSVKTELRTSRSLNLSISGGQLVEAGQVQYVLGGSYKVADFHPWGILPNSKVKNDMRLNADFSFKNSSALIRKIEENYSQATSGNKTVSLDLQADYVISRNLNLKFYYSLESSIPLVSSYPVTTQDFGLSFRFSLTR